MCAVPILLGGLFPFVQDVLFLSVHVTPCTLIFAQRGRSLLYCDPPAFARTTHPPLHIAYLHPTPPVFRGSNWQSSTEVNEAMAAAVSAAEEAAKAKFALQLAASAEELRGRDEAIGLLEKEVVEMDRELTLKDKVRELSRVGPHGSVFDLALQRGRLTAIGMQAIELLQRQLRAEQEARREETRCVPPSSESHTHTRTHTFKPAYIRRHAITHNAPSANMPHLRERARTHSRTRIRTRVSRVYL